MTTHLADASLNWLSGGGEMGKLIRSMDWSTTALGAPAEWPQSLRTAVSLCLNSTFPILICWGPEDIQIYNDAYRPICGAKHPESMGMNFKICWETALPVVGDAFDRAHHGEGVYINNQRMFLDRFGYLEEAWMTFSFSSIRDESGAVGGVFHPITETTHAMLSARRTQFVKDLSHALSNAKSLEEIAALAQRQLEASNLDVPFLAFYRCDGGERPRFVASAGIEPQALLIDVAWPMTESLEEVTGLASLGEFRSGPYDVWPSTAMVIPLFAAGGAAPYGHVVAGVSACRALDDEYRTFYGLLGATFNTALSNALAYEQELKRAEALAELDRAKTVFFSNVSHEFRTPLTLILGPLEDALADGDDPLTGNQRHRQELVHRNALRLLKLVNSLLDFSRIEAGRMQANFIQCDLAKLTADIASSFRSATDRAGLGLTIVAPPLGDDFFVDQELFEKIVLNLMSNAFKFTFDGSITVALVPTETGARLSVSDTGVGIAEAELPKIFDRFHRVHGNRSRSFEGTGIGLALVKELVLLHGATLQVESRVGEGTTFTIDILRGHAHLPKDQLGKLPSLDGTGIATGAFVQEALRWIPEHREPSLESGPGARARVEAGHHPLRHHDADLGRDRILEGTPGESGHRPHPGGAPVRARR